MPRSGYTSNSVSWGLGPLRALAIVGGVRDDNNEISNVAWFTWEEATHMIRGHYTDKIKVLKQSYFLFLNIYLNYIKNYKQNYIQL